MIETLSDFIREYKKVKEKSWIKTHRSGDAGVGNTLEDLLGIEENNRDEPDFGEYELKAGRMESNSMLTLLTRAPSLLAENKKKAKKLYNTRSANGYLRMKYGYASGKYDNDEKVLHVTLSTKKYSPISTTGHSFKLTYDDSNIYIKNEKGIKEAYWNKAALKRWFEKKYKRSFVYARASAKGKKENEEFSYVDAYEVCGFSYDSFIQLLERGEIYIDLRIGQYHKGEKAGKIHDHGTAFRIRIDKHKNLFKKIV